MDTTAYLIRQGWLGSGHALGARAQGIKKPVLVSQKTNTLGVGKKAYDAHADQWWSRAFDETLRSVNGAGQTEAPRVSSTPAGIYSGKWTGGGGLYGGFVRGQGLEGTIRKEEKRAERGEVGENGRKRKRTEKSMAARKRLDDGSSKEIRSCDTDMKCPPARTVELPVPLSNVLECKNPDLQASHSQEPIPTHEDAPRVKEKKKRRRDDHVNGTTDTLPTGGDPNPGRHNGKRTEDRPKKAAAPLTAITIDSEPVQSHEERNFRHLKKKRCRR